MQSGQTYLPSIAIKSSKKIYSVMTKKKELSNGRSDAFRSDISAEYSNKNEYFAQAEL